MKNLNFILFFFTVISIFSGCGTDTGNPFVEGIPADNYNDSPPPAYPVPVPGELPFIKIMAELSCTKLAACHDGLNYTQCNSQFYKLKNIDIEIGLEIGDFSNLREVFTAEIRSDLIADPTASTLCQIHFDQLECNDPVIQNSWQPGSKYPMGLFEEALPESCKDVFLNTE